MTGIHVSTDVETDGLAGQMRADHLLPMHHGTFRLGMEPVGEPIERMMAAAGRDEARVVVRQVGGTFYA